MFILRNTQVGFFNSECNTTKSWQQAGRPQVFFFFLSLTLIILNSDSVACLVQTEVLPFSYSNTHPSFRLRYIFKTSKSVSSATRTSLTSIAVLLVAASVRTSFCFGCGRRSEIPMTWSFAAPLYVLWERAPFTILCTKVEHDQHSLQGGESSPSLL